MKDDALTAVVVFVTAIFTHLLMALVIQAIWNWGLHRELNQIPELSYFAALSGYSIIKIAFAPAQVPNQDK